MNTMSSKTKLLQVGGRFCINCLLWYFLFTLCLCVSYWTAFRELWGIMQNYEGDKMPIFPLYLNIRRLFLKFSTILHHKANWNRGKGKNLRIFSFFKCYRRIFCWNIHVIYSSLLKCSMSRCLFAGFQYGSVIFSTMTPITVNLCW